MKGLGAFIGTWRFEGPSPEGVPGYVQKGSQCRIQFSWRWILDKQAVMQDLQVEFEGNKQISQKELIGWNAADKQIVLGGQARLLLLFTAVCLMTLNLSETKKPANPGVDDMGLVNPAYIIMDGDNISRLKLLSFDGLEEQEIVKARAFQGMKAPTFSPDGQWVADKKGEDDRRSLQMIRPDGSGERIIYFENGPLLEPIHGMQWVPGEVDRIIYCAPIGSTWTGIRVLISARSRTLPEDGS